MENQTIRVDCNWNGRWENMSLPSRRYVDGEQTQFRIRRGGTYEELLQLISNEIQVDLRKVQVKIVVVFSRADGLLEEITIKNDRGLQMAIEVCEEMCLKFLHIYLELKGQHSEQRHRTIQVETHQEVHQAISASMYTPEIGSIDPISLRSPAVGLGLTQLPDACGSQDGAGSSSQPSKDDGAFCSVGDLVHQEGDTTYCSTNRHGVNDDDPKKEGEDENVLLETSRRDGEPIHMEAPPVRKDPKSSTPTVPVFGQPAISSTSPGFGFGSTASSVGSVFQFGGQQNQKPMQNPPLFQPSGSLDFGAGGSFSLGSSGGGDKANRRFVKVKHKNQKR